MNTQEQVNTRHLDMNCLDYKRLEIENKKPA